ncbi:MAG: hypothetical protein K6E59_06900 [Bacilli bacterium]|nr:hypothetical protein [Bacilli bacterium]
MKRKLILLPLLVLLPACQANNGVSWPNCSLVMATPSGAPAVAFYKYVANPNATIEVNAVPKNVLGYISASSGKDIVVAPTHGGIKAIQAGAPFKIAATLTFGNFYLASTGNDDNGVLDADDYVVAFQENDVPGKVFKYCYSDLTNVHYLAGDKAAADAATCLATGKNAADDNASVDYVFLAEPALSTVMGKKPTVKQYASIQDKFAEVSGGLSLTQASLFVSDNADKTKVNEFLSNLSADVASFLKDPTVIDPYVESLSETEFASKFNASVANLKALTSNGNRMGLGYKKAIDNIDAIANFVALFGVKDVNETLCYV